MDKKYKPDVELCTDKSYFNITDNGYAYRFSRFGLSYGTVIFPDGVKKIGDFSYKNIDYVILPDGVEKIERSAFKGCDRLKKIFIPKSVKVIADEVFLWCNKVEIYCEGEPQEGWLDGEKVERKYLEDMTDAFNFHRSGGSFDDCYLVERTETIYNNYNPHKRPVHTNVSRAEFEALLEEEKAKQENEEN